MPLFSTRSAIELVAITATFLVLTGAWCWAGWVLVSHPAVGPRIRGPARIVTPLVLIGLGVLILVEARVWTLLV